MREWRRALAALASADRDLRNARVSGMWEADALRARAYAGIGLLDSAVASGRSAVAAAERVRGRIGTGSLRTSFASERSAIYADLVVALLRSNKNAEAFEVADAARGRELLEHLAEAKRDVSKKGVTDFAEGERLLRQINELTRLLNEADRVPQRERASADEERMTAIAERLAHLENEYEGLATRARNNGVQSRILGSGHAQVAEVSRSLEPSEALVEYMVTPEHVLVFVVRRERLMQLTIDVKEQELAGRVRVARGLAGKRTPLDVRDDAVFHALHALLIAPVEKSGALRGINRIIVVPHSVLVYLPFATLIDETGKYLSDKYAILHAPSGSAVVSLRSRRKDQTGRNRAVVLAPFPATLPSTVKEARDVRQSIASSRMLLGSSANERALRNALADARIVHVASHGYLNRRNPLFSRIELAQPVSAGNSSSSDDGRLDLHEVFGMTIGSQLVFLSGCETGLGTAWSTDFARGEDFATLAQAFLYSGAREVIATLWRLDDEAAAVFASRFYRNLKDLPPAEALAAAQREVRSDSRFQAPYNWAAYTLSGSGDRLSLAKPWWNPFN
jgi:CHAT domain-containing protein